jgi:lipopolysaccharide/colanic/teichoic acid biosynthesis glycosyltransferase
MERFMPVLEVTNSVRAKVEPRIHFAGARASGNRRFAASGDKPPDEPRTGSMVSASRPDLMIRAFDIVVALFAITLFLPLALVIAVLIAADGPGPVIFRQRRVGRHGTMFPCLKFRTMVVDAQARLDRLLDESEDARLEWERDQKLRRDPRITGIGAVLRKTSLDELPQLLNVLAGHMSIVGPRPIIHSEIDRYGTRFAAYCSVRPGLTGLWQISGRNDVSYEMRVRLDSLYARRRSLGLNVAICFKTVPAMLTSRGCY